MHKPTYALLVTSNVMHQKIKNLKFKMTVSRLFNMMHRIAFRVGSIPKFNGSSRKSSQ